MEMNSFGAIPPASDVAALITPATETCGPTGAAGLTVRVTLTVRDVTPGLETVTTPLNEPAVRLVGFTENDSADGADPEAGETVNQVAVDEAVQGSAPPPAFVTETPCATGIVPPTV
jgi:hypothetical protein